MRWMPCIGEDWIWMARDHFVADDDEYDEKTSRHKPLLSFSRGVWPFFVAIAFLAS